MAGELVEQCETYYQKSQYDSAYYFATEALIHAELGGDSRSLALAYYWIGKSNSALDKFKEAIRAFDESAKWAAQTTDTLILANCYNDLGRTYRRQSKYSLALANFNKARIYYYATNNEEGIALVSLNVGNVLKNIGNSDLAKKEYWSALIYFREVGDVSNEAGCYNNLGNIYKNEEQYDSAFYYMYKTLAIREKGKSKTTLGYIYHNLANLHLAQSNTDSALFYIEKSLAINQAIWSDQGMANDYNVLGSVFIQLKDWDQALAYLKKALELTAENEISENKLDILKQLAFTSFQKGMYKESSTYYNQYFALNDTLIVSNQQSAVEQELMRYELFSDSLKTTQLRLEKDLELVKKENTTLANQINFRNYLYVIIILFLVLVIVAILFITARRNLAQTRAHQVILSAQNEELKRTLISKEEKEILLKEVHHRVKNNLQIINSLIRLQSHYMNAKNFREKLMETENRIRSMALIHEKLYKTGNLARLSVRNYIEELSFNILESYENHNVKIRMKFDLEEREYGIDSLIPLGLIINEVISNSLKHAFYGRNEGNIWISIKTEGDFTRMVLRDDGIGADLSPEELKEDSLGLELIESLTEQLNGQMNLHMEAGFEYSFVFEKLK